MCTLPYIAHASLVACQLCIIDVRKVCFVAVVVFFFFAGDILELIFHRCNIIFHYLSSDGRCFTH